MNKKVVLTLSGGMDSSVLLFMSCKNGFGEVHTITFDYGQRHSRELECIPKQIDHCSKTYPNVRITNKIIDCKFIKDIAPSSSLTNLEIDNPDIKSIAGDAQPVSYVPFRNMMFLSICNSYAEGVGADVVWYGAAQVDSLAGYWDGSHEFLNAINSVNSLNRKHRIHIEAPLLTMSKADIIRTGVQLGVNFADTWTCYSNREDRLADITTPSSSLRVKGFVDAKYKDPVKYVQQEQLEVIYKQKGCKDIY